MEKIKPPRAKRCYTEEQVLAMRAIYDAAPKYVPVTGKRYRTEPSGRTRLRPLKGSGRVERGVLKELIARFGGAPSSISHICQRKTYRHLP